MKLHQTDASLLFPPPLPTGATNTDRSDRRSLARWGLGRCHMPLGLVTAIAVLATVTPAAHAQWTVTNLHPAGSTDSVALAASGGQQAGYTIVGGVRRASLWSGTAASWVDLHPAGSTYSIALAASGGQQAGFADVGGVRRAAPRPPGSICTRSCPPDSRIASRGVSQATVPLSTSRALALTP